MSIYQRLVELDAELAKIVEGGDVFLLRVLALRAAIKAVKVFF